MRCPTCNQEIADPVNYARTLLTKTQRKVFDILYRDTYTDIDELNDRLPTMSRDNVYTHISNIKLRIFDTGVFLYHKPGLGYRISKYASND